MSFAAGPACTSSSRASNPVAACGPKLRPAAAACTRCRAIGLHAALRSAARVSAALRPIEGAEQIARYIDITSRAPSSMTILERTVNGQPGLVARQDGVTVTVFAFDVAGDRITHIWAVRNPGKLRPWTARWPDGTWAFPVSGHLGPLHGAVGRPSGSALAMTKARRRSPRVSGFPDRRFASETDPCRIGAVSGGANPMTARVQIICSGAVCRGCDGWPGQRVSPGRGPHLAWRRQLAWRAGRGERAALREGDRA